jgi:predicted O-methyltransferase YrrM
MVDLISSLKTNFKLRGMRGDNLPHLLTPRERDGGREAIGKVLNELGARDGVEIGVSRGFSAIVWLDANPEMHLSLIDPWMDRREKFYPEACERFKGRNVTILRMKSMDALQKFPDGSLDFVHIDGNHEFDFVMTDIIFWMHKLKSKGIMAVHDYIEFHKGGVIDAVRSYTRCHKIDPWFITRDRLPTVIWEKR